MRQLHVDEINKNIDENKKTVNENWLQKELYSLERKQNEKEMKMKNML